NSVLIPYFKLTCELSVKEAMLVAFAFYISYFVMAIPSSFILKKTGYKNGMMFGLFVMAAGALVFLPAASTRAYPIFLLGLFIEAAGLTLLQTAANPYITILGPIESAASRISIMGVCNKTAGAIAPLLLVGAIVKNPDEIDQVKTQLLTMTRIQQEHVLDELSARLIMPYIVMAVVLVCLGLTIKLAHLPDINDETSNALPPSVPKENKSLLQHRHLVLGAIAIFCAVGVEVLAVDSIINYAQYTGLSFREAKYFATYTLLLMIASYCIGIFTIPKLIKQRKALMLSALIGLLFSIVAISIKGAGSVWFIAFLGLGNALLWPAIWPLSLEGLGKLTSRGSALLIMGVIGGGLLPLLYGAISDAANPRIAYAVLIPLYLFILYFSLSGYKSSYRSLRPEH
ncbi:MAG TPA: sugar MFS transporter, partial [Parafilimonas sp.]|nr:sugar MFS transporter [Parafilimonas sp.]